MMKNYFLFLLLLALSVISNPLLAKSDDELNSKIISYEANISHERKQFEWFEPNNSLTSIEDPVGDNVAFQNSTQAKTTPFLADIKSMTIIREDASWKVIFETWQVIPNDPGMPVNFHIYLDNDRNAQNNSPSGVFRAGTDIGIMLLFGTRTKWHSMLWRYNSIDNKWERHDINLAFSIAPKKFLISIPYEIAPRERFPKIRGLSLVSNNAGLTIIDLIPGRGIPEALVTP